MLHEINPGAWKSMNMQKMEEACCVAAVNKLKIT